MTKQESHCFSCGSVKSVAVGSIFGCLTLTGSIAIIAAHIEAER